MRSGDLFQWSIWILNLWNPELQIVDTVMDPLESTFALSRLGSPPPPLAISILGPTS
jgi:hypothetical protein